jgi:hypothetical protein
MGMKHLTFLCWTSDVEQKHAIGGCEGNQSFKKNLKALDSYQIHNMLALMLNPHL